MNKIFTFLIAGVAVVAVITVFLKDKADFGLSQDSFKLKEEDFNSTANTANIEAYLDTNNWKAHESNNFSFKHSESFKATSIPNESGEVIVFEDDRFGFQIFSMPFDESGPITVDRILQDLPDA